MDTYQTSIAGVDFIEPILAGLLIDFGIAQIHLIVGESAPPHSWENPKYFRLVFEEIIEIRSYISRMPCYIDRNEKRPIVFSKEEIDWGQDLDAQNEIEFLSNGRGVLKNTVFRDLGSSGRTWQVWDPKSVRLFWLNSDSMYIEFLYSGKIKVIELSEEVFQEEVASQSNRFYLAE